jgi:signal transduction histidine kinase
VRVEHPSPEQYQPRLAWYSHVWRYAGAVAIGVVVWSATSMGPQWERNQALFWTDLALGILGLVLMAFRRRWPMPIAVVVTALGALSNFSIGAATVVTVSLATHRRWPQIVVIAAFGIVLGLVYPVVQPGAGEQWWLTSSLNVAGTVAVIATGMYLGSRRELLWTLRERAERAEAEQELRVRQARTSERSRIAREMHDVLAHRISLVTMHAGALSYRTDLTPEQVAASAEVIQENAHRALTDLRHVLGVLRSDDGDRAEDRPQPTFEDIAALVEEARRSGMRVDLVSEVLDAPSMPDLVGRTAYRIVQEGLTNARKHSPGARVKVRLAGGPEHGVDVRVHNLLPVGDPPRAPGAGLGLVGLTERAELAGGTLRHERDGRAFTLQGWLPWAA